MNAFDRRALLLTLIVAMLLGASIGYSQTPPGPNTIQQGDGANMPTVTAQYGYFYGWPAPVNVTGRLFGNYTGLPLTGTTLDTGQGPNELYDMNQNVLTTSAVTFVTVDTGQGANELYPMDQGVTSTDDVVFNSVDLSGPLPIAFNGTAIEPDALLYPTTEASYVIWTDNSTGTPAYYAKNGSTGQIQFSGAVFSTVIQSCADSLPFSQPSGGMLFIKGGTYVVTVQIDLKGHVLLQGEGIESTLIQASFAFTGKMFSWAPLAGDPQFFLGFRDMKIDGNIKATYGIYQANLAVEPVDFYMHKVFITRTVTKGAYIGSPWGAHISECIIESNTGAGLQVDASAQSYIHNNFFAYNHGDYGLKISSDKSIISNNNFYQNDKTGIYVTKTYTIIEGNEFLQNNYIDGAFGDIWLETTAHNTLINGNIFSGNNHPTYAVKIASNNNVITNNKIDGCGTPSIIDTGTGNKIDENMGYIAPGEERSASGSLTAGVANAISFAWNNPETQDVLIKKVVVEITTGGGTVGSHLDVGIADDAAGTNRGTEFFNDLLLNNVAIDDSFVAGDGGTQTKWVFCEDNVAVANDWVVGQILDANAAALVGKYYIVYAGR